MAERRLARETRKAAILEEEVERQAREEEQRQKAEHLAKDIALKQKREEKKLAKMVSGLDGGSVMLKECKQGMQFRIVVRCGLSNVSPSLCAPPQMPNVSTF